MRHCESFAVVRNRRIYDDHRMLSIGDPCQPVDGIPGPNTWKGIQTTVRRYGYYHGPVDGVPGPNTYRGMQMYARDGGGYTGPVDGVLGPNSWAGFVRRLSS